MKKNLLLILMVFIIASLVIGCTSNKECIEKQLTNERIVEVTYIEGSLADSDGRYSIIAKGDYYFFSCRFSKEYVLFLSELDLEVYEIIDIQIERFNDNCFFVTYKRINTD